MGEREGKVEKGETEGGNRWRGRSWKMIVGQEAGSADNREIR